MVLYDTISFLSSPSTLGMPVLDPISLHTNSVLLRSLR